MHIRVILWIAKRLVGRPTSRFASSDCLHRLSGRIVGLFPSHVVPFATMSLFG